MYENKTPEAIRQAILDNTGADVSTVEGSFASDMAAPTSVELAKMYDALEAQRQLLFVVDLTGAELEKRASEYAITRKAGTKATGEVTVTGTAGATLPAGSVLMTIDNLKYITDASLTLAGATGTVTVTAAETGVRYNVPGGSVTRFYRAYTGISGVTNVTAITGGVDVESDDDLRDRLLLRIQTPATSGNAYHYQQWALDVDGVGAAKVIPLWNGAGTVKVLLASPDMGQVSQAVVASAAAHIEAERPIGASVTVASAESLDVNVAATVVIAASTTISQVTAALQQLLDDYFAEIAFDVYEISVNKIAYLIMSIPGVTDYTALTLNGSATNITIGQNQIPRRGTVTVDAAT